MASRFESCSSAVTNGHNREVPWHQAQLTSLDEMGHLVAVLIEIMADVGYSDADIKSMNLALTEALSNAMKHGHYGDPSKAIQVRYQVEQRQTWVEVQDQGPGFDPNQLPNPTAPNRQEARGGRGVYLMRAFMSSVHFNERGNCVTLCKKLS